ncbi:DUF4145 domain-containing protein [Yersinia rochesterensis]|uniref:DUF4145 domain-containing protein n=1 Tax=Yersinia rochesterensis TaxID=1604335 RepID=UPI0025AA44CE|nr:DUF4145 domain-containing protein [Yersinia rochesterensis]MDN0108799.1 DUF4145 domain-containing protein [Yersinia rochesterensis]
MAMVSLGHVTCPHCLKENAVLEYAGEIYQSLKGLWALSFICRSCNGITVAETKPSFDDTKIDGFQAYSKAYLQDIVLDGRGWGKLSGVVKRLYPIPNVHVAPESTPDKVAKFFVESKDNFQRGNFETCGSLCRKVIDLATKNIAEQEEITAWKLQKRIEKLKDAGAITKEMFEWAEIIRIDGNETVHSEEEFDAESAKELLDFTETFLMYAFTLPAMVKRKRNAEESP